MKDGQKPSFFLEKISGCNLHQADTLACKVQGKVEGYKRRNSRARFGVRLAVGWCAVDCAGTGLGAMLTPVPFLCLL